MGFADDAGVRYGRLTMTNPDTRRRWIGRLWVARLAAVVNAIADVVLSGFRR